MFLGKNIKTTELFCPKYTREEIYEFWIIIVYHSYKIPEINEVMQINLGHTKAMMMEQMYVSPTSSCINNSLAFF